jgi:hypothetical protein
LRKYFMLVLALALLASGCSNPGNPFFNVQVLNVTPTSATIARGQTLQLTATGNLFQDGVQDVTNSVEWATGSVNVATVSSTGLVTGTGQGTINIRARLNGREAFCEVTVVSAVTALSVDPDGSFLRVGTTERLTATATFDDRAVLDISDQVEWSTADATVATVNDVGAVTAVGVGQTTITAVSENGTTAQATVNVFDVTIFSAGGANAAVIQPTVDSFRAALGPLNPNTAQVFPTGRREINWDGVPAAQTNTNAFPANFFNVNSPRGVIFATNGSGFRVSDNAYGDVNATYPTQFQAFSPVKLFATLGASRFDTEFFLPNTNTPAVSSAFGAVFCDPDRNTSSIIFVLPDGSTFTPTVTALPGSRGLAFLGVQFQGASCREVTLVTGEAPLSGANNDVTNGGANDMVVVDDFIYAEPQPAR